MSQEITVKLQDEDLEKLNTWVPCTRVRLVHVEGEPRRLELDTRATCDHCHGRGVWDGNGYKARCKFCSGTGLR